MLQITESRIMRDQPLQLFTLSPLFMPRYCARTNDTHAHTHTHTHTHTRTQLIVNSHRLGTFNKRRLRHKSIPSSYSIPMHHCEDVAALVRVTWSQKKDDMSASTLACGTARATSNSRHACVWTISAAIALHNHKTQDSGRTQIRARC